MNDDSSPKALSLFPTLIGDTEETSPNGSGDAINPFSKFEEENGFDAKSSARKMYLQREKVIRDHSIWSR